MTHLNLIFNQMPGGSFAYPQRKDKTRPGAGPPEERMKNGRPSENFSKAPLRFTALTFSQSLYVHTLKRRRRGGHLHCPVPQPVFDLNDLLECRHGSLNRASHKDSYLLVKTSAIGAGSFHPFGLLKVRAGQAESATLSSPKKPARFPSAGLVGGAVRRSKERDEIRNSPIVREFLKHRKAHRARLYDPAGPSGSRASLGGKPASVR